MKSLNKFGVISITPGQELIFANKIATLALLFFMLPLAMGEGEPFKISAPIPEELLSQTGKFTTELKHQAIVRWLKKYMGENFAAVEERVTPEFTEKYVLDFSRRKYFAGKQYMEVTGHLDSKALKQWARVASVKTENSALNPLFIVSADFPENKISPQETSLKVQSSKFGKSVKALLEESLSKLNVKLKIIPLSRFPLEKPARNKSQIRALREVALATDSKTALWVHLSSCYSCGGGKLDLYLYNFEQSRIAAAETADLALSQSEMASEAKLKDIITPHLSRFSKRLEKLISGGALFSSVFRLTVKGIPYTSHKVLEKEFQKLDYIVRILLKSVEPDGAEFEIMSSVGLSEFSTRLGKSAFAGFNLKVVRIDSDGVVVRYWKKQATRPNDNGRKSRDS